MEDEANHKAVKNINAQLKEIEKQSKGEEIDGDVRLTAPEIKSQFKEDLGS
jgi:hypothetical protein